MMLMMVFNQYTEINKSIDYLQISNKLNKEKRTFRFTECIFFMPI